MLLITILLIGLGSITSGEKLDVFKFEREELSEKLLKNIKTDNSYYLVTRTYMIYLESELQYLQSKFDIATELIDYYDKEYSKIKWLKIEIKILIFTTCFFSICFVGILTGVITYCILAYNLNKP